MFSSTPLSLLKKEGYQLPPNKKWGVQVECNNICNKDIKKSTVTLRRLDQSLA